MGLPAVAKKVLFSILPNISELAVKVHATMVIRTTPQKSEHDCGTSKADIDNLRILVANIERRLVLQSQIVVGRMELLVGVV